MTRVDIYHVRIPMQYAFGHARASRRQADNVFVKVRLRDGSTGWGECVPREYVTGETIESVVRVLSEAPLGDVVPPASCSFEEAVCQLWQCDVLEKLSALGNANAATCAFEIALLDAWSRREDRNVYALLSEIEELKPLARSSPRSAVRHTLTLPEDLEGALARAGQPGPDIDVKLKVGFGKEVDLERASYIRERLGTDIDLRLDANAAWSLSDALETLEPMRELLVTSVEEPLKARSFRECSTLRSAVGIPVMLDESLCSMEDARAAQAEAATDFFNLRVSKCGGLLATLRLASFAHANGIGYQIGCMVGESGILTAVGRGFAANVEGCRYLESTMPHRSLERDVTDAQLETNLATRLAEVPTGSGTGVRVDEDVLNRYTVAFHTRQV